MVNFKLRFQMQMGLHGSDYAETHMSRLNVPRLAPRLSGVIFFGVCDVAGLYSKENHSPQSLWQLMS